MWYLCEGARNLVLSTEIGDGVPVSSVEVRGTELFIGQKIAIEMKKNLLIMFRFLKESMVQLTRRCTNRYNICAFVLNMLDGCHRGIQHIRSHMTMQKQC